MDSVVVQLHSFLNSAPESVERSTGHRMEAGEVVDANSGMTHMAPGGLG